MYENHRIEAFLDEHHITYSIVDHPRSATSLNTAHAAHLEPARLAKGVLLEGEGCLLAAMIPADQDIRLGQLQANYGYRLRLASVDTIRQIFPDCDSGVVPGLPNAWGVETVWDDDLLAQPDLYLEAGDHRHLIHLDTRSLHGALDELDHCHFSGPRHAHTAAA